MQGCSLDIGHVHELCKRAWLRVARTGARYHTLRVVCRRIKG